MLANASRKQRLPDQFLEKRARIEMLRRRQILEGPGQSPAGRRGTLRNGFRHTTSVIYTLAPPKEMENANVF
jgi:hypothetical protein